MLWGVWQPALSFWCARSLSAGLLLCLSVLAPPLLLLGSCCSASFTYGLFDVRPVVLLPLCSWYRAGVFLVISGFFLAFWRWCCVRSGLSHRHLCFYLCIIFRVILALFSICYRVPQSRWWPFPLPASWNAPRNVLLLPFYVFVFILSWITTVNLLSDFLSFAPRDLFFIPRPFKCFTAFVSDAYTYLRLY